MRRRRSFWPAAFPALSACHEGFGPSPRRTLRRSCGVVHRLPGRHAGFPDSVVYRHAGSDRPTPGGRSGYARLVETAGQPKNPLHGLTLAAILEQLVAHYGWDELSRQVRIQCFANDPSIQSSLKFLRRTPWAREKVESYYLWHLREQKRQVRRGE